MYKWKDGSEWNFEKLLKMKEIKVKEERKDHVKVCDRNMYDDGVEISK